MDKSKVKIHYIYHSGFAVETSNHILVFDYFKEKDSVNKFKNLLKSKSNVLVFSSHNHHDHFNPEILEWDTINGNIKYILSSDITIENWKNNYYKLSQNEELTLENNNKKELRNIKPIYIKAFGSTDIGISFLVKIDGVTLFHAGDLNWWHWKDDSEEERNLMEENFKLEVSKIKGENIDVVFFPVDPRLEEYYSIGAEYFIKEVKPEVLIPMHFGDNHYITKEFAKKIHELSTKAVVINSEGEELSL